jgi:predicted Fe-Mo cluster-binding NifX family protein
MVTRTIILFVSILLFTGTCKAQEADPYANQRCAIAAEGPGLTDEITHLTGRAPYYQVYDLHGTPIEVIENVYLVQEFNIGPQAAALLSEKQVTLLVGGMAGPKMMDVLEEKEIRFVYRKGAVKDVVEELKKE